MSTTVLGVRLTGEERALVDARAAEGGEAATAWARHVLVAAARDREAPETKPTRKSVEVGTSGPSAKAVAWIKGLTDAEAKAQHEEVKKHWDWYQPTRMKPLAYDPHARLTPDHLKFIFRT